MNYRGISFSAPTDTTGMFSESQKKIVLPLPAHSLANKLTRGVMAMRMEAASAGHRTILRNELRKPVIEGTAADLKLRGHEARLKRDKHKVRGGPGGGEANFRLPNRASFSASSFRRGDKVAHSAGHARGIVLGPSRSKPGMVKVSIDGETYRVDPRNLQKI